MRELKWVVAQREASKNPNYASAASISPLSSKGESWWLSAEAAGGCAEESYDGLNLENTPDAVGKESAAACEGQVINPTRQQYLSIEYHSLIPCFPICCLVVNEHGSAGRLCV